MKSLEEQYAAGQLACSPDENNYKPDIGLEELLEHFNARKARHLVMHEFNTLFTIECLLSGYDTYGNEKEYVVSFKLVAVTKESALSELDSYGLHEYYSERFKRDCYLAW